MEAGVAQVVLGVVVSVITGFISGGMSSQRTISALVVHIEYLRTDIKRHDEAFLRMEAAIVRAHDRVDKLERAA